MLTAVNESGRRFSLQGEERLETLKKLRDKHRFYCEACGKPLILKLGQKVAWHFAHKPNMSCHGENEPESIVHLEGKRALYHWLNAQGEFPILEKYIPDIKQRADLFLHHHPKAIAIEYQCSNLTPQRFMERTAGYLSLDIRPIWILGENRLKNYGSYIYRWHLTEELLLNRKGKPYALFFSATSNRFIILHHFWPLASSTVVADRTEIPAEQFCLHDLWQPPLLTHDLPQKAQIWLQQKSKWRTRKSEHPSRLERYVLAICKKRGLPFESFPAYIGLPIPEALPIASPPFLWQAWLILQFIHGRPLGSILHVDAITKSVLTLADRKLMVLRENSKRREVVSAAIERYLSALHTIGIVAKTKAGYVIMREVAWTSQNLADHQREDERILYKWLAEKNAYC